ncbi:hypothetical protein F4Y59_06355 [Candidatus Poribacteria bacterium]|nr:hypothetical protein [Candidatus Poribacteria bacterium]
MLIVQVGFYIAGLAIAGFLGVEESILRVGVYLLLIWLLGRLIWRLYQNAKQDDRINAKTSSRDEER